MKTPRIEPMRGAVLSTATSPEAVSPLPAFSIEGFERLDYGSKVAQFKASFAHLTIDVDLFAPIGKEAFVAPGSVRSKYDGAYKRLVRMSPELATALLDEAQRLYNGEGS